MRLRSIARRRGHRGLLGRAASEPSSQVRESVVGPSGEGEFQVTGRARPKVSRQAEAWWLRGQKESLVRLMVRTRGFGLYSLQGGGGFGWTSVRYGNRLSQIGMVCPVGLSVCRSALPSAPLAAWRLCKEGRLEGTERNLRFILITKPPLRPAEATIVPTLGPRGGSHEFSPQPCPEGRREALVPADFPT